MLLTVDGFVKLADMGAARGTGDDGNIGGTTHYGTTCTMALLTMAPPTMAPLTMDDGNIGGAVTTGLLAHRLILSLAGKVTDSATKTGKAVDPTRGRRMTITGTHGYRAPEVYERCYGKGADWWNVRLPPQPCCPLTTP